MDLERTKRLQAILKWSLRQQEEEGERIQGPIGRQIDPERQQWLQEALESFSSQPSETDLLKAALTVLKVHTSTNTSVSTVLTDAQQKNLEEAFEQVKYFVEDLDHANDLIPLKGVDVIVCYLNSDNMYFIKMACELVAVASQNNPTSQEAFLPSMSRLLQVLSDSQSTDDVKIQAVRAISSLSRGYEPGLQELFTQNGFSVVIDCLHSKVQKVTIKALFMLSHFYASEVNKEIQGLLHANVGKLLVVLTELLKTCKDSEILEHLLSLLSSLLHNRLPLVKKQPDLSGNLKDALLKMQSSLSSGTQEEYAKIESLIRTLDYS